MTIHINKYIKTVHKTEPDFSGRRIGLCLEFGIANIIGKLRKKWHKKIQVVRGRGTRGSP